MSETISFVDHNFMMTQLPQIVLVLFMLFPRLYLGANNIISMIQIFFNTFHENVDVRIKSESQNCYNERKPNSKEKEYLCQRGCGFHVPFNRINTYRE